ncbi:MAG TPA: hypothetical protein VHZ29_13605 [Rhizomicrobium sp.]|jgi:hypothetical protein|nr:hypothetical protein [Rhizomicrobium sp.]
MKRLIVATLVGTLASAVVLFVKLALSDPASLAVIESRLDAPGAAATFGTILLALAAAGGIPTVLIGAALMLSRRASPVTLVLTPAILFLFVLTEVARETRDATLQFDCLPAMAVGGAAMFWILWLWKIPQPIEAVFE